MTGTTARARPRVVRADGQETRRAILDAAGVVFAEKGYGRSTSKEICQLAGVDLAAVNYHFGNKDGLYRELLVEAHRGLIDLDELQAIAQAPAGEPVEKLASLLRLLLTRVPNAAQSWRLRVLVQEMMAPTEHVPVVVRQAVLPKVLIVRALVAKVLELRPDDPIVQRAVAFVVLPCLALLVAPANVRRTLLPAVDQNPQETLDDLLAYVMAGLDALKSRRR